VHAKALLEPAFDGRSRCYIYPVFGIGFGELATLLLVALVVFGPRELPRYSRKAGQLMGRARDWVRDIEDVRVLVAGAFGALAALAVMAIYLIGIAVRGR
jgi:hypothetical protein